MWWGLCRVVKFSGPPLSRLPCQPNREPDFLLVLRAYTTSLNLKAKVLDFIQLGGPMLTIDRTIFEMWLGKL